MGAKVVIRTAGLALALIAGQALAEPGASPPAPSYVVSNANAGATPIEGLRVYKAFHEKAGIDRIAVDIVGRYRSDPRIKDIFAAVDADRLTRLLAEQFCYVLGGPCHYTGRDMKSVHADMGVQTADFDAVVEDLGAAMDDEHVPYWAQSKLLAKLAPLKRQVVTR